MSRDISATLGEQLIALRHELHRFPELSNQEFETTARLRKHLEQHQIRIVNLPLKTGLVAEIGQSPGPLIVLRADIDALPIEEQSGVSYQSERPGVSPHAAADRQRDSAATPLRAPPTLPASAAPVLYWSPAGGTAFSPASVHQ